jgi:hypothetical protein
MSAVASPRTTADEKLHVVTLPVEGRGHHRPRSAAVRMAMYFSPDGTLHHARCRQPLQFQGVRAELEGDFRCLACHEHVSVPRYALPGIPVEDETETERTNVLRLVR